MYKRRKKDEIKRFGRERKHLREWRRHRFCYFSLFFRCFVVVHSKKKLFRFFYSGVWFSNRKHIKTSRITNGLPFSVVCCLIFHCFFTKRDEILSKFKSLKLWTSYHIKKTQHFYYFFNPFTLHRWIVLCWMCGTLYSSSLRFSVEKNRVIVNWKWLQVA